MFTTGLIAFAVATGDAMRTAPPRTKAAAVAQVEVPKIVGVPRSNAVCILEAVGLQWRGEGDPPRSSRAARSGRLAWQCAGGRGIQPDPPIVTQSVPAGRMVPVGTEITFVDYCYELTLQQPPAGCM